MADAKTVEKIRKKLAKESVAQLRKLADEKGVDGANKMSKVDLIQALTVQPAKKPESALENAEGAIVEDIDRERASEVRTRINDARRKIDDSFTDMAVLLNEVYHDKYYLVYEFGSFKDYVEGELGIKYRRAMAYVEIAGMLADHNIPVDRAKAIGWSKLRELPSIITPENRIEWLTKAETMSKSELQEAVRAVKSGGGKTEREEKFRLTVSCPISDGQIITEAVTQAKAVAGVGDTGSALAHICGSWLETHGESRLDISHWVSFIEKQYGVTVTVEGEPKTQTATENELDLEGLGGEESATGDTEEMTEEDLSSLLGE
jgi:hypothetical protein